MVLFGSLALMLLAMPVSDSVVRDLNSPDWKVRDGARETLRQSFVPTPKKPWTDLIASMNLKTGESQKDVAEAFQKNGLSLAAMDTKVDYTSRVKLDSCWIISVTFSSRALLHFELLLNPGLLVTSPPTGYTGIWRTYCLNGDKAYEVYYSHGMPCGPLGDGGMSIMPNLPPTRIPAPNPPP